MAGAGMTGRQALSPPYPIAPRDAMARRTSCTCKFLRRSAETGAFIAPATRRSAAVTFHVSLHPRTSSDEGVFDLVQAQSHVKLRVQ